MQGLSSPHWGLIQTKASPKLRMPKFLSARLQSLFAPRPPLEHLAPPVARKMPAYSGVGAFLNRFEDPETSAPREEEPIEILKPSEIRQRKRKRVTEEYEEENAKKFKLCALFRYYMLRLRCEY